MPDLNREVLAVPRELFETLQRSASRLATVAYNIRQRDGKLTRAEIDDVGAHGANLDDALEAIRAARLSASPAAVLLDPDMSDDQLRLHAGELTAQGLRDFRAGMRFALGRAAVPESAEVAGGVRDLDSGRFEAWSDADIIGQLRMQSRDQLDPEFSAFMSECSKRLAAAEARGAERMREASVDAVDKLRWPEDHSHETAVANQIVDEVIAAIRALPISDVPAPKPGGGE